MSKKPPSARWAADRGRRHFHGCLLWSRTAWSCRTWSMMNCISVCVCESRKASGHHLLVLCTLETASTRGDTKTNVSKQTHVLSLCGSFRPSRHPVSVLQAWTRSTPSCCWRSLLVRVSRRWGRSVWSDRLAIKFRSPTIQTQNRWPLGSVPKASPNRKSTRRPSNPNVARSVFISPIFRLKYLKMIQTSVLTSVNRLSMQLMQGWTPFALQGRRMFGDPHRGPTLFPQQRRAEGGVRRRRQPHLLADHRAEGAGGGQSRLSCIFLGAYVNL